MLHTLTEPKTLIAVGVLAHLWFWESYQPFRHFHEDRRRHAVRNLGLALFNVLLLTLLLGSVTALVATWTAERGVGLLNVLDVRKVGRVVLAVLLLDAWMYLWHRANHALPLLWHFHRLHHADTAMDVTTATRFHPGEVLLAGVLRLGLIPLLGLSLSEVLIYETLTVAVTQFHHANISLGRGEFYLRRLLVTPAMHQVHHSNWRPETDSNFGVLLPMWDWLGNTLRRREHVEDIQLGLRNVTSNEQGRLATLRRSVLADNASAKRR